MQRLSIRLLALLCVLGLSGTSFITKPTAETPPPQAYQPSYYWYNTLFGSLDDFTTVAEEIWVLEEDYGVVVNQSPGGGTLLELGYFNNAMPHNEPPSIFLYGHF